MQEVACLLDCCRSDDVQDKDKEEDLKAGEKQGDKLIQTETAHQGRVGVLLCSVCM